MNENEIELTAHRFLRFVRSYLIEMTKGFRNKSYIDVILPLSEEEFEKTFIALNKIREIAKRHNITVEIEDINISLEEFGHTNCLRIRDLDHLKK